MDDTIMRAFFVRASGNIGQVVFGPDGEIIAWTTDAWVAQVIAKLLSENEELFSQRRNDNETSKAKPPRHRPN